MAKTQEELTQLKNEVEAMNKKLSELTDEELNMVTGGNKQDIYAMKPSDDFELPIQLEGLCPSCNRCDEGMQVNGDGSCAVCSNHKYHEKISYCALGYGYFSNGGKL